MTTMKNTVHSNEAPAAIGPYSQAIKTDKFLFCSGQIPLVPETGKLVSDDIAEQTECVLSNLGKVLAAGGCSFEHVVKTTIYLTDLADFSVVNEVYGRLFNNEPPARATVQVAALPKGAKVEIDAIAVLL